MSCLTTTSRGIILPVHAVPRSSATVLQGLYGDTIKIRLGAPPAEGKANVALIRFLSQSLGIPSGQITLLSGASGRRKRVLVTGMIESNIRKKLGI